MDGDLARAIALSLQEQTKEDDDLKRAIELSQQTFSNGISTTNRKRKASEEVVEILTSDDDDDDMDADLKMAIELSKTLNHTSTAEQSSEEHVFQQHYVDEDRELALQLQS